MLVASACKPINGGAASASGSNAAEVLVHPSGGFLAHARSSVVPFCHAVLIASDIVVTSAHCAEDGWWELSFGTGDVSQETIPVEDFLLHPLAHDEHHALVALVLSRPVRRVAPATTVASEALPCGVEIPSYDAALRGDRGERRVWTACALESSEPSPRTIFVATDGTPSCHGDRGAGAFAPGSGPDRVIGWVTAVGMLGPPHPIDDACVTDVEIASASENLDFLDEARALSRFPAAL